MLMKGTTILAVIKDNQVAMAGDGQVSLGNTILKNDACKVRKIYSQSVLVGFAGSTSDALILFENFEKYLNQYKGDVQKSAVELAKHWRSDKMLRRLEAMMLVASLKDLFLLSGSGDVIKPEKDILAIGSGGSFAYAAALAYIDSSKYTACQIAKKSLDIASQICIYTNNHIIVEELT